MKDSYFNKPISQYYNHSPSWQGDMFVFLVAVLSVFYINIIGELYLSELALILALPILVKRIGGLFFSKTLKAVLFFAIIWLISQVVSDIFNEIELNDRLRGVGRIIFFMGSIMGISLLVTTPKRVFLMFAGFAVAKLYYPFKLFDSFDFLIFWKYGLGAAIFSLVTLYPIYMIFKYDNSSRWVKFIVASLLVFSIISFFLNSRSFAGILLINAVMLSVYYLSLRGRLIQKKAMVFFLVGGLLLAAGVLKLYGYGASTGVFGQPALDKYNMQVIYGDDPLSLLLAGRSESLVSKVAIADSPILGHGSWAKDFKYVVLYHQIRQEFSDDLINPISDDEVGLIPSHSYLLGAWVESGVFGALFWLFIIYLIVFKAFPSAVFNASPLSILFMLSFVGMLWSIFFSPFGATARVVFAFNIVLFSLVIRERDKYS